MGFEPTISVLERAKTVRALDRAATVNGKLKEIRGDPQMASETDHSNQLPVSSGLISNALKYMFLPLGTAASLSVAKYILKEE
jgi:hypothetical protein